MDNETKSKIDNLQLTWFVKTTKGLIYDFKLKDYEAVKQFVNELFTLNQTENYFPDIVIHKQLNVRVEIYNKQNSQIGMREAEIAQKVENIYIQKYKV